MSPPGPTGASWGLALLGWAALTALLGDAVRSVAVRWVGTWRSLDPIERGVLDLYLGGATLFLLAALPFAFFTPEVAAGLALVGAAAVAVRLVRRGARDGIDRVARCARSLGRPAALVALASAAGLFAVELAAALPSATGNTYDASVFTLFTALLRQHATLPLALGPYATGGILYPQGTTVWLAWGQMVFGLPAARTSLLLTPLFLGIAPLAGFVLGRRLIGDDRGGVAFAVALAWLGPGTRALVGGSNDLAAAVPLVLLLAAEMPMWTRAEPPGWGDVVGFGLLTGYSASLNPTGAEWLLPLVLLLGVVVPAVRGRGLGRRLARWAGAVAAALLGLAPTLFVLALGRSSPGFTPGVAAPPPGYTTALTGRELLPRLDPFLFGPNDLALSSVAWVRVELAVLLGAGLLVFLVRPPSAVADRIRPWRDVAVTAMAVLIALLALFIVPPAEVPLIGAFQALSSADELSLWLFLFFGLVAAVPILVAVDVATGSSEPSAGPSRTPAERTRRPAPLDRRAWVAAAVVAVLVLPGIALTPTSLGPALRTTYAEFGNLSAADFALLAYAGAHLPGGARVLVAPGSAAEFLPGYASNIVLLYPMTAGWYWSNASYTLVVRELTNGTLDGAGLGAMAALDVGYVAVTMNNTVLWPAFSPAPLLADPGTFVPLWHEGDAYLFQRT